MDMVLTALYVCIAVPLFVVGVDAGFNWVLCTPILHSLRKCALFRVTGAHIMTQAVIQWNASNPDITGLEKAVRKSVLISEVSSFQGFKCIQDWYLGMENVSSLERYPH